MKNVPMYVSYMFVYMSYVFAVHGLLWHVRLYGRFCRL